MAEFIRAAIYTRVSTTHQSTDLQRQELAEYASLRGFVVVNHYEDIATGTSTIKRPKWQEMMASARRRKFDVVLCWKLDRFSRSLKDLVVSLQELESVGVKFISLRDNIDLTTPSGRLMVHLVSAFSEFEASIIRERVKAGIAAARAKGKKFGRTSTLDVAKIKELRAEGQSLRSISIAIGASKGGVSKVLNKNNVKSSNIS